MKKKVKLAFNIVHNEVYTKLLPGTNTKMFPMMQSFNAQKKMKCIQDSLWAKISKKYTNWSHA